MAGDVKGDEECGECGGGGMLDEHTRCRECKGTGKLTTKLVALCLSCGGARGLSAGRRRLSECVGCGAPTHGQIRLPKAIADIVAASQMTKLVALCLSCGGARGLSASRRQVSNCVGCGAPTHGQIRLPKAFADIVAASQMTKQPGGRRP